MIDAGSVLVVVSTFNRPNYLKLFVDSVLLQTYDNIDIIVSDNSTNEETKEMVELLFNDKVRYLRLGSGLSASDHAIAIENYIKKLNYNFLVLSHDDDLMGRFHIEQAVNELNNNNISAVSTCSLLIDEKGDKTGTQCLPNVFLDRVISGYWGVLLTCWINPMICPSIVRKKDKHCSPTIDFSSTSLGYNDYTNNILTIYYSGVVISSKKTFSYRIHGSQDSSNYSDNHTKLHVKARNLAIDKINCSIISKYFIRLTFFFLDVVCLTYKNIIKYVKCR